MTRWFAGRRAMLAGALAAMLLAGCATPQRIGGLAHEQAFERVGRFAITVDQPDLPTEAVQGGFAWRDTGAQLLLDLANPLGSTLARVSVEPGRATLTRSDGSTETAPDADALVLQVLGGEVPVAGLRYWLRGQAGPAPVQERADDAQGRLSSLRQDGWLVQLSRYDEQGPRQLRLLRSQDNRQVQLRLVVNGP